MPGYANGNDAKAVEPTNRALNSEIRTVNADTPIRVGGAVHCTTRELPRRVTGYAQKSAWSLQVAKLTRKVYKDSKNASSSRKRA